MGVQLFLRKTPSVNRKGYIPDGPVMWWYDVSHIELGSAKRGTGTGATFLRKLIIYGHCSICRSLQNGSFCGEK